MLFENLNNTMIFSIVSLVYIFVLTIVFLFKKKINSLELRIFKLLIFVNLISLIIECLICYFMVHHFELLDIILKVFNVCLFSYIYVVFLYSYVISKNKSTLNFKDLFFSISFILYLMFVVGILILDVHFNDVAYLQYSYGPSVEAVYLAVITFFIIINTLIIANYKKIKGKKAIPMILLIVLLTVNAIVQFSFPNMLFTNSIFSLVTFVMYHTIENPDVKMIEQLEIARDVADKANAAKTDFLSSMSHEIRTPLNAIVGFSDCIKHADSLEEAKENATDIITASNTLLEIVNGILDISKIEAGKLEIINSDYNAHDLFLGLAKLVTPKMNEKGLDFQVSIADDLPPTLYGDNANIKKAITNLLSNAYKYTDSGFVKYEVRCVNNNGVCRLIVSVEDSGRGIRKEDIDKLFTKFQRVDETRNTTIEGTGLGLAITKQLIELMGGNIVVHSNYGEGSKFIITLDQSLSEVKVVTKKEVSLENVDLSGKRILVVDDNPINLKVTSKTLGHLKATIDLCDSGFACLDKINSGEKYDVIFMDDMMPKMSGVQTLKKLKEIDNFNTPVFALTANALTGMREKYLKEGFNDYLSKPIEKEEVIRALGNIFDVSSKVCEEVIEEIKENIEPEIINNVVEEKDSNTVEFLESNGIDVDHGLELLGDIDLYNDTMNDFVDEIEKRLPLLGEYKNNSDMPNYAIIVHAIKSDCKYLGIMNLADLSYEHELKSKANDIEFVNANYDELINLIENYVSICKNYLNRD